MKRFFKTSFIALILFLAVFVPKTFASETPSKDEIVDFLRNFTEINGVPFVTKFDSYNDSNIMLADYVESKDFTDEQIEATVEGINNLKTKFVEYNFTTFDNLTEEQCNELIQIADETFRNIDINLNIYVERLPIAMVDIDYTYPGNYGYDVSGYRQIFIDQIVEVTDNRLKQTILSGGGFPYSTSCDKNNNGELELSELFNYGYMSLNLNYIPEDSTVFNYMNGVSLYFNNIDTIDNLEILKTRYFSEIHLENINNISDIDSINNISSYSLTIKNVGNFKNIDFNFNNSLSLLTVYYSDNVESIKATNVGDVRIENCKNINSITLGDITSLSISKCDKLNNLDLNLSNLKNLSLTDLSNLEQIYNLNLEDLNSIYLTNCPKLKYFNLSDLSKIEYLSIHECESLSFENFDFSNNNRLNSLKIKGMSSLKTIKGIKNIYSLEIENCENVKEIEINSVDSYGLTNLNLVGIGNLEKLTIPDDINISWVRINNCGNLDFIKTLKNSTIYTLELLNIQNIKNLSCIKDMTKVSSLNVNNCSIEDASAISNMVNLNNISITNTKITKIPKLTDITAFKNGNGYANFKNNEIDDISEYIKINPSYIDLSGNNISDISSILKLSNVNSIVLNDNNIEGEIEITDKTLYTLNLSNNNINKLTLKNVKTGDIYLNGNSFSELNFDNVSSAYDGYERVNLFLNNCELKKLPDFSGISGFKALFISNNDISDISTLTNYPSLKYISIVENNVNPWDEKTFHVICTLQENGVELLLGDCSKFDPDINSQEEVDVIKEETKDDIKSVVIDDETIDVLPAETSDDIRKEDFIDNNFNIPEGGRVEAVNGNGEVIPDGDKLGSRSVITIYDDKNNVVASIIIAIKGDVTGNGEGGLFDSFKILIGTLTDQKLDEIDQIIRDYNDDGVIALFDAFKFLIKAIQG